MVESIIVILISALAGYVSYRFLSLLYVGEMKKDLPTQYKYVVWVGVCAFSVLWHCMCKPLSEDGYIYVLLAGMFLIINIVPMALMDAGTKTVYVGNVLCCLVGVAIQFLSFVIVSGEWHRLLTLLVIYGVSFLCSVFGGYKRADHYVLLSCVMVWMITKYWDLKILAFLICVAVVHGVCFFIPFVLSRNKRSVVNPFMPSILIAFLITIFIY